MTGTLTIREALRLTGTRAHTMASDDLAGDVQLADDAVASVKNMPQPKLYAALVAAGLDGIKPRDSRLALLRRLHNRLTARYRAVLRAEV